MNLCIDQGNSSTKVGVFENNELVGSFSYLQFGNTDIEELISKYKINNCILSSVVSVDVENLIYLKEKFDFFLELTHLTLLPIKNQYRTPETLGKDRLAAVIGANFLVPDTNILVIDAGTAITFDFIDDKKNYQGGNISAGLDIRLRSLHDFTQKLPLVEVKSESPFLGFDTESALISGALQGVVFEIDGYINVLKIKYPQLSTFLTGGSTFYFDTKLKNAIFAERNLVLIGLNQILQYNV